MRRHPAHCRWINPGWIEPLAEHLVQRTYSVSALDIPTAGSGDGLRARHTLLLAGRTPAAAARLGPVDPVQWCELFIRQGLVRGPGYETRGVKFLAHNQQLFADLEALQGEIVPA